MTSALQPRLSELQERFVPLPRPTRVLCAAACLDSLLALPETVARLSPSAHAAFVEAAAVSRRWVEGTASAGDCARSSRRAARFIPPFAAGDPLRRFRFYVAYSACAVTQAASDLRRRSSVTAAKADMAIYAVAYAIDAAPAPALEALDAFLHQQTGLSLSAEHAVLGDLLLQTGLSPEAVRLYQLAPLLLLEHRRTYDKLLELRSLTRALHLHPRDALPRLLREALAATSEVIAVIAQAEGRAPRAARKARPFGTVAAPLD